MLPANIEVSLDKRAIRQYIEKRLDEEIQQTLWLVDLEKIAELTCMSKRWLEDEIISDVRMRTIEIKKSRKRWWPYKAAFDVINEITSEW